MNGKKYRGKNTLVAVGGYPTIPNIPGAQYGIDSDGFFELEKLPKYLSILLFLYSTLGKQ